jgi:hypothetical protein
VTGDGDKTVRLVLTCVQGDSCSVIFEPYGTEYILQRDDDFHVELRGPGNGEVLVWYGPGAISITPWLGGDYAKVTTASGKVLDV